jgi:hypothetical protein
LRRIASWSKCSVLMSHRATYFLNVRWFPPAGRRAIFRSASAQDCEVATASRGSDSEKLVPLGTNACLHAVRMATARPASASDAVLGSQGSNLILSIQSAPCCQLHHSPVKAANGLADTTMPSCLNPPS